MKTVERNPKEKRAIEGVTLCIGANWKASFVPEDELLEAINEFLRLPRYDELFDLVKNGSVKMHVANKATRDRVGCWLSFELNKES